MLHGTSDSKSFGTRQDLKKRADAWGVLAALPPAHIRVAIEGDFEDFTAALQLDLADVCRPSDVQMDAEGTPCAGA